MFESKYLVIAFERHLAFAYRNTFEKEGRRIGVKISVCYVVVAVLITTVKIVVYLYDPTEKTIDGLLHRAFFVEGPAMFFISCLVLSTVAWIFGIYKIHSFSQLVAQKLEFTSLTEKFIVKQVNLVLRFLKPLSLISFISVLVSTLCSIFVLVILMDGFNEHSASYKAAANAIFCSIASYNLFASVYNIYSFKPMNKLMKQDFHWFFKLNTRVNSVCNPQKSAAELQQEHFDNLEVIWTKTQPRPRSV
ncbi:hypothetical protein M3Y98_00017900 [Aphelenchoides besseyi]|nr:hypothetical protein M3Y98_00017900 [Aphelenchoides besseyi]